MRSKLLIAAGALLALSLIIGLVVFIGPKQDSSPHPPGPDITSNSQLQAEPGDTVIKLTWKPVPGASGYLIYRNGNSAPLNATPISATSYSDIGLSNGHSYTYTVGTLDAGGKPGERLPDVKMAPKSR
jgi:hypothetical protein